MDLIDFSKSMRKSKEKVTIPAKEPWSVNSEIAEKQSKY